MRSVSVWPPIQKLPMKATLSSQNSTVGFHWMNSRLWSSSVAPPKISTSSVDSACSGGMRRWRSQSNASRASIVTISTAVAAYSPRKE